MWTLGWMVAGWLVLFIWRWKGSSLLWYGTVKRPAPALTSLSDLI
jgi:hypothetical protein